MHDHSNLSLTNHKVCNRCIYDERVASISFDESGVCNYCHQIDDLIDEYGTGLPKGEARLAQTVETIKREGHGKKYDCVIGVSGGTDSSYMVHLAKEWGLRPLAVHYDNTWNSAIATQNIEKVLRPLNVDLFTWVVNNKEADDILGRSFWLVCRNWKLRQISPMQKYFSMQPINITSARFWRATPSSMKA
ncbi:adenine nucleotide alpha hydrolase family protein [Allopontixanthobacter confluentis]|uniref:hypothetical protein n=1 Tax=Allopontixanthobacter confluentis TaxID=1849021 RepID=UPI001926E11A|nr:hypothetical protein [Allopontixanthobacter confluentis]